LDQRVKVTDLVGRINESKESVGKSSYKFHAIWSQYDEDETEEILAILLPNEVFFITLKDEIVCPTVNKSYNCLAWSPSSESKGMILAASDNSIDLLNAHTGVIFKSFQNIFDNNSASGE
jgi:hypothetical protein